MINTSIVKYKEEKKRSKSIGFIALKKDVVMLSDSCKSDDMIDFLEVIRKQNPDKLCIVLDNARIHHAKAVKARAEELDIYFIYLPPYSPDLNPIEFGWKDLKRELSKILDFDEMINRSEEIALDIFGERRYSYSKYWVEEFISAEN